MLNKKVVIGLDVGGTHIRMGAIDEKGEIIYENKFSSRSIECDDSAGALLLEIEKFISDCKGCEIEAVSIGFPSTINKDRSIVLSTPNIKGLNNVPIKEMYEKRLGMPVFIEKDGCMLMHYDILTNNISQSGMIIGCYIGTGLGNIILIDGAMWVGKDGAACELGHIPVIGGDRLCGCGNTGCLEMYAGGRALAELCERKFPDIAVSEIFTLHSDDEEVLEYVGKVAVAVATEINILNPDCIVLGGGVIFTQNFPYEYLIELIHKYTRKPYPEENLYIVRSNCEDHFAGVLGANIYARKMLQYN